MDVGTAAHALVDPVGFLLQGVTSLLGHFISGARDAMLGVLDRFLFRTVDPTTGGHRPLTANPNLINLNLGMAVAVDVLITAVLLFTGVRSILEHSLRSKYDLKVIVPRVLLAVVLAHSSLLFIQMAVDLNNAMGSVALSLGAPVTADTVPWAPSLSPVTLARVVAGQDIFQVLMAVGLVVAMVILVLTYVIRSALLNVLIVTAPLAALLSVVPDTRTHARTWMRMFTATLFMQAVQLLVLRVAITTEFDSSGGLVTTIYALATLWLMLKVPGALGTGVHLESKAHTLYHSLERSVRRDVVPAHHTTHRKAA
jgi:hypothetical protein